MTKLSASKLGVFKNCARCFWFQEVQGIKLPRGIFPSLPGGVDRVLKAWFDTWRNNGKFPPEVNLEGSPYKNQTELNGWRNWRSGLTASLGNNLLVIGAIDDLHVDKLNGFFSPLDYKSRGSTPNEGDSEKYYGHQMDVYALLLEANGMQTTGKAYLIYYWPVEVFNLEGTGRSAKFAFDCEVVTIGADPKKAKVMATNALDCINSALPPPPTPECEQCVYVEQIVASIRR